MGLRLRPVLRTFERITAAPTNLFSSACFNSSRIFCAFSSTFFILASNLYHPVSLLLMIFLTRWSVCACVWAQEINKCVCVGEGRGRVNMCVINDMGQHSLTRKLRLPRCFLHRSLFVYDGLRRSNLNCFEMILRQSKNGFIGIVRSFPFK